MHGGRLLELAQKNSKSPDYYLDFSASINPYGMDKGLKQVLKNSISLLEHYPNENYEEIKNLIGRKHNVNPNNVYIGNGANSIIYRLLQCFDKPLNICIPVPSFESYNSAAGSLSSNIVYYHMFDKELTEGIFNVLSKNIDILILANPNNPTGFLINSELLDKIFRHCLDNKIFLILDESFLGLKYNGELYSGLKNVDIYNNMAVLRSMTKLYAFPGLRFGYLVSSNRELHERLNKLTPSWEVNTLALEAAKYSLKQNMDEIIEKIQYEKQILEYNLKSLGIYVYPSETNFLLCKFKYNLYNFLLNCGIIVRNCGDFMDLDERYFRIAVRKRRENERLILEIKKIIFGDLHG